MSRADAWTAQWACEKLISHSEILGVMPSGANQIRLEVKDFPVPVFVSTMSDPHVDLSRVPPSFLDPQTQFLLNIPKEAYFDGDLLAAAANIPVGVGGLGDLYVAAGEKDFRRYIPKEPRFILRGLGQHTAVSGVRRMNDRTYLISKHRGDPVQVLALNEYDVSADVIRGGIAKYGLPRFVLASNPNCRISPEATAAVRFAGTGVLVWRQLLGALNN